MKVTYPIGIVTFRRVIFFYTVSAKGWENMNIATKRIGNSGHTKGGICKFHLLVNLIRFIYHTSCQTVIKTREEGQLSYLNPFF